MLLQKHHSLMLLVDVQEKLMPLVLNSKECLARCEWLLKLSQAMDVPILASEQYPKGLGHTVDTLQVYLSPNDCMEKTYFSCMQEPSYLSRLQHYNKTQLILCGIEAHVCVLQTALEMRETGFEVFVVVDAVSSRNERDLRYGLKRMKHSGVHLVTAEMVFFEWLRHSQLPEFKELSKTFLQ